MKTSPLILSLVLSLGAASAGAMTVGSVVRNPDAQQADSSKKDAQFESFCLRQTGSRIVSDKNDGARRCLSNGRAYTRQDLERTGETDLAAALRKLDPAIH